MKTKSKLNIQRLAKAMTVEERIQYLRKNQANHLASDEALEQWLNRKSVIDFSTLTKYLKTNGWTPQEFCTAIDQNFNVHTGDVAQMSWITTFEKVFDDKNQQIDLTSFSSQADYGYYYLIRHFLGFFDAELSKILKSSCRKITSKSKLNFMETLGARLVNTALKTFINEMHLRKEKNVLVGKTSKARFDNFLLTLGQKENLLIFFYQNPVLARRLTAMTQDYVKFIREFFYNVNEASSNLKKQFNIDQNDEIIAVTGDSGDCHQKGKTVMILKFSKSGKIVYKPRQLNLEKHFTKFETEICNLAKLHNINYLPLLIQKHIVGKDYTFEEFIEQEPATNISEVEQYFTRFGEILGFMYMLNGGDMHYENIIAHGSYPVIVDFEALLSNFITRSDYKDSALNKSKFKIANSVTSSILLPQQFVLDHAGNTADLSALNGNRQTLKKETFVPTSLQTDHARFTKKKLTLASANNAVVFKGKIVDASRYSQEIINGFKSLTSVFLSSKTDILKNGLLDQFSKDIVRTIPRNTTIYAQFLEFLNHPSCMTDAVQCEKILENLFVFPFENKHIVTAEISDLTNGDIPIFFERANKLDLITSDNSVIYSAFSETSFDKVKDKVAALSPQVIKFQTTIAKVKMGVAGEFETRSERIIGKDDQQEFSKTLLIKDACSYADKLISQADYSKSDNAFSWLSINDDEVNNFDFGTITNNLYDGLPGLFLYFFSIYLMTGEKKYKQAALRCFKTSRFYDSTPSRHNSKFLGYFSLLEPTLRILQSGYKNEDLTDYVYESLGYLEKFVNEDTFETDWLLGDSSLIGTLLRAYDYVGDESILILVDVLAKKLDFQKVVKENNITNLGVAHGLSGYLLAQVKLYEYLPSEENMALIQMLYAQLIDKIQLEQFNNSWCNGLAGIGIALAAAENKLLERPSELFHSLEEKISSSKFSNDDCYCHGIGGILGFYSYLESLHNVSYSNKTDKLLKGLQRKGDSFNVLKFDGFPDLGLFKGTPGVFYSMMQYTNKELPNLLEA